MVGARHRLDRDTLEWACRSSSETIPDCRQHWQLVAYPHRSRCASEPRLLDREAAMRLLDRLSYALCLVIVGLTGVIGVLGLLVILRLVWEMLWR